MSECTYCGYTEPPRKVYAVTLHSRGGKTIYVETLARKKAVEAADRIQLAGI